MKTILIANLFAIMFFGHVYGQKNFENFYNQYNDTEGVETFEINPKAFQFLINNDDEEMDDILVKIENLSFVICEEVTPHLVRELDSNLPSRSYKDVMIIKDGPTTITFKAKESAFGIDELIMTVTGEEDLVVMCITGTFTRQDAESLANSVDVGNTISFSGN